MMRAFYVLLLAKDISWMLNSEKNQLTVIELHLSEGTRQAGGWAGGQAGGWAGGQAGGWAGGQAGGWAGGQAGGWAGGQAGGWAGGQAGSLSVSRNLQ